MKVVSTIFIIILGLIISACENFSTGTQSQKGDHVKINEQGDSVVYRYNDKGKLTSFTTIKNGYKHGLAKKFYANGKVQFEINYVNGYKQGKVMSFYKNGKPAKRSTYVKGKLNGIQKRYYENGKLLAEIPYELGNVLPGTREYNKDGKLRKIYPVIEYETIDRLTFENKFVYRLFLSNHSKSPKFYKILPESNNGQKIKVVIPTQKGVGTLMYRVNSGGFVMEKVKIWAEYKSSLQIPIVIEKVINVAIDGK